MTKGRIFIILFSLCAIVIQAQTTYYIDNTSGNDSNSGQSDQTAWKTLGKVESYSNNPGFLPGDKILFKRGEVWQGESLNFKSSGTQELPITMGAYSFGSKPIISAVSEISGYNWVLDTPNTNIYKTSQEVNNPGRIFIDSNGNSAVDHGEEILKAYDRGNLGLLTYSKVGNDPLDPFDPLEPLDQDRWYWDGTERVLYLYTEQHPNNLSILKSTNENDRFFHIDFINQHDILIENINFQGGVNCIYIGTRGNISKTNGNYNSYNIKITNCNIGAYSSAPITMRGVNNIIIEDNHFHSEYFLNAGLTAIDIDIDSPHISGSDFRGVDDAIRIRDEGINCLISENTFYNWSHNAVQLENKTTVAFDGVKNNKILHNYISAGDDLSYSRAFGVQGITNGVTYNEIAYNTVVNTSIQSQIAGEHNSIHHNIFNGMTQSRLRPSGFTYAINVQNNQLDYEAKNNNFDNNLIIDCADGGIIINNPFINRNPIEYNSFRNNVIYNCGKDNNGIGITIVEPFPNLDPSEVKNNFYLNNLIYSFDDQGNQMDTTVSYHEQTFTISDFENNLINGDNASDNVALDPDFEDATFSNGNYHFNPSSPCNESGNIGVQSENYNMDFYGALFPNQLPDIGHEEISPKRTKLHTEYCNEVLEIDEGVIECFPIFDAHHYKFRFVNNQNPQDVFYYNTNVSGHQPDLNQMNVFERSWAVAKESYSVTVRALLNPEETQGYSYGEECIITIPHLTKLTDEFCDKELDINNSLLECYPIVGANRYLFNIVNTENGTQYWYNNYTSNTMDISSQAWFQTDVAYNIRVRAFTNEYPNGFSYGDICQVKYEIPFIITTRSQSNTRIYPNPTSNRLNIKSEQQIQSIQVVDVFGNLKRVDVLNDFSGINTQKLSKGLYFIQINYGDYQEHLSFVKD